MLLEGQLAGLLTVPELEDDDSPDDEDDPPPLQELNSRLKLNTKRKKRSLLIYFH